MTTKGEPMKSTGDSLAHALQSLRLDADVLRDARGLPARTPIDGSTLGYVPMTTPRGADEALARAAAAQRLWRLVPAPRRGELVRRFGNVLRENKAALGELVTLETGKIAQEGEGEVQEMIDICDFAVGLSRQLHGLTIASPSVRSPIRSTAMSPSAASNSRSVRARSSCTAHAQSGVFSDGFHATALPQTSASAAFHAHTATGKLNAEMTPQTPSGCQVSIMR